MPDQKDDRDTEFYASGGETGGGSHAEPGDGGPFGAVVVRGSEIISRGWNRVTSTNDPTAHAEVVAIRAAAEALQSFSLEGCVLYTSCEPCPMCLAAAYWARMERIGLAADLATMRPPRALTTSSFTRNLGCLFRSEGFARTKRCVRPQCWFLRSGAPCRTRSFISGCTCRFFSPHGWSAAWPPAWRATRGESHALPAQRPPPHRESLRAPRWPASGAALPRLCCHE